MSLKFTENAKKWLSEGEKRGEKHASDEACGGVFAGDELKSQNHQQRGLVK